MNQATYICIQVQHQLEHLNPNHNRRQQREFIQHNVNNWIHAAVKEWETPVENTPENREKLAQTLYRKAPDGDKEAAYVAHHADYFLDYDDEEFNEAWQEHVRGAR